MIYKNFYELIKQVEGCEELEKHAISTVTNTINCPHNTGWYVNVKFWIFTKTVFVCSDCGNARRV